MAQVVNLAEKLGQFNDHWSPKIVADYNANDVMVVKFQGEFPFHVHEDTDDFFLVIKGRIRIDIEGEDGGVNSFDVEEGEMFIVPRGVRHRPVAEQEAHVLLIEPAGEPNTGDPATAAVKTRL